MDTLGNRVLAARKEAKISAKALAERVGITRQALHLIETGKTKMPAGDLVQRLATELKVESSWLVTGEIGAKLRIIGATSQPARPDLETLRAAIEMVESALAELGIDYPPKTKAQIVVAVYAAIEASGEAVAAKDVVATMLKTVSQAVKT